MVWRRSSNENLSVFVAGCARRGSSKALCAVQTKASMIWTAVTFASPSHLNVSPLDLADVDSRVDARPDVHEDVRPHYPHVSGQAVDFHLACRNALVP